MPVSTIAQLREQTNKSFEKAKATYELTSRVISALRSEEIVPTSVYDFGYCANASLTFDEGSALQKLLTLYPPMDVVDVRGSEQSQKPLKYLRPQDSGFSDVVPLFPVVFKTSKSGANSESQARWWTSLDGLDVQVSVEGATFENLSDEIRIALQYDYLADSHQYSTGSAMFFKLLPQESGARDDSLTVWGQSWDDYAESVGMTEVQKKKFVAYRKALVQGNANFCDPQHKSFVEEAEGKLPAALSAFRAEVAAVKGWLAQFIAQHGPCHTYDEFNIARYVQIRMESELGFRLKFQKMDLSSRNTATVWPALALVEEYPHWSFPHLADAPRSLRLQDIGVKYKEGIKF